MTEQKIEITEGMIRLIFPDGEYIYLSSKKLKDIMIEYTQGPNFIHFPLE